MNTEKFVELVERMREAQNSYFKRRNSYALQRALILEKLVDDEIKNFKEEQKANNRQPDLFDGM